MVWCHHYVTKFFIFADMEGLVFLLIIGVAVYFIVKKSAANKLERMRFMQMIQAEQRSKKEAFENNGYINYHKKKLRNETMYDQYINWMDENNIPGAPKDKLTFSEDIKAEEKIKRIINPLP